MAERAGVKAARLEGTAGVSFTLDQIEAALKLNKPKARVKNLKFQIPLSSRFSSTFLLSSDP